MQTIPNKKELLNTLPYVTSYTYILKVIFLKVILFIEYTVYLETDYRGIIAMELILQTIGK